MNLGSHRLREELYGTCISRYAKVSLDCAFLSTIYNFYFSSKIVVSKHPHKLRMSSLKGICGNDKIFTLKTNTEGVVYFQQQKCNLHATRWLKSYFLNFFIKNKKKRKSTRKMWKIKEKRSLPAFRYYINKK